MRNRLKLVMACLSAILLFAVGDRVTAMQVQAAENGAVTIIKSTVSGGDAGGGIRFEKNGKVYDANDATKMSNDYATGYLFSDGTLYVEFTSKAKEATGISDYPWADVKDQIKSVNFSCKRVATESNVIGAYAFYGCTGITGDFYSRADNIGAHAFEGCSGLSGELKLEYLHGMGDCAFKGTGFSSVIFPDIARSLKGGKDCLAEMENLTLIKIDKKYIDSNDNVFSWFSVSEPTETEIKYITSAKADEIHKQYDEFHMPATPWYGSRYAAPMYVSYEEEDADYSKWASANRVKPGSLPKKEADESSASEDSANSGGSSSSISTSSTSDSTSSDNDDNNDNNDNNGSSNGASYDVGVTVWPGVASVPAGTKIRRADGNLVDFDPDKLQISATAKAVTEEEMKKIISPDNAAAKGLRIVAGSVYPIEITLSNDGESVSELTNPVTIVVTIPGNVPVNLNQSVAIVRIHGNKTEIIDASVNPSTRIVTFTTDRFSTYALVNVVNSNQAVSPKTGDDGIIGYVFFAAALAGTASVFAVCGFSVYRKKMYKI